MKKGIKFLLLVPISLIVGFIAYCFAIFASLIFSQSYDFAWLAIIIGIIVFGLALFSFMKIEVKGIIIIVSLAVLLLYGFLLFLESVETEAIYTPRGVFNLLTFQCYNGAGGNSWCDSCSYFHTDEKVSCGYPKPEYYIKYGDSYQYERPRMVWDQILGK